MEERIINRNIYVFNKKSMSKNLLVILITIIFIFDNKKVYGQIEVNNFQKKEINKIVNQNIEKVLNTFMVDNNTYKILDEGVAMLWSYDAENDTKDIVVKNSVNYDGSTYEVRYIYEKAFEKNNNIRSIKIENNILGFCDSYGNLIKWLDRFFKDNKILRSIEFENIESFMGEKCFYGCSKLVNIKIPKELKTIQRSCFEQCKSLKNIDLSEIKEIKGKRNFQFCESLEDIGGFNDELRELPESAFKNCSSLKVGNLNNICKLGDECFMYCVLLNSDILMNVEEIGEDCFYGCNFNEVYLKKAKKICKGAFGGMANLKKFRFGTPKIPDLSEGVVMGSSIEEWIYPKNYINEPEYSFFLAKLEMSTVKWNPNYDNLEYEVTQHMKLDSLKPPNIKRAGYEIEGWYKEAECINKVNKIADLGEEIDSDIVVKNPQLYAKWIAKEESKINEGDKKENENNKPKEDSESIKEEVVPSDKPKDQESENNDKKQTEKAKVVEEFSKLNELSKSEGEKVNNKLDEQKLNKRQKKSKKKIKHNKNNDFSKKLIDTKKNQNDINNFNIKINNNRKNIKFEKCNRLALDYKMAEAFAAQAFRNNNIQLEALNISYKDIVNNNMELNKSWILGKIMINNECVGIYLKSNQCSEDDKKIEIEFKSNTNLCNLYVHNEELGEFILINDNLKVKDNLIKIMNSNKKEYLITNAELNGKEDVQEG
jgi:hypothetical protein